MEQSLENENRIIKTCDVVMNELNVMEENNVEECFSINPSLQSKTGKKMETKNEEMMNQNFKELHN